jgi:uncharacterized membrane protein
METKNGGWTDERVDLIVSRFLLVGIIVASVFVFIGGVFYLAAYGTDIPEYKIFSGEPAALRSVHGIVADAVSLRSRGIIQLGLLLLMFTPVAWVAFLLFAFAKQKDRTYVVVTAIVLATLLYSLVGKYLHS